MAMFLLFQLGLLYIVNGYIISSYHNYQLARWCGFRPYYKSHVHYNSTIAQEGQFPFAVEISLQIGHTRTHHCGGTLITKRHVLTASHCIDATEHCGEAQIPIEIYKLSLGNLIKFSGYQLTVTKVIGHPDWNKSINCLSNGGDIAILELSSDVPEQLLNEGKAGFICLPTSDEAIGRQKFITCGWGATLATNPDNALTWTALVPMPWMECKNRRDELSFPLANDTICARELDANVCAGDSGGPLLKKDHQGRYKVMGVISNGEMCNTMVKGMEYTGGAYTDVRKHLHWICKHTGACYTLYGHALSRF